MFLRRGPTASVRRPGILTDGHVARAVRAYSAGTGRGRIADDSGNLAVAVRFDGAISSGLLNFGGDIVIVSLHFEWGLQSLIVNNAEHLIFSGRLAGGPDVHAVHDFASAVSALPNHWCTRFQGLVVCRTTRQ